ncbi:tyrosine-type recombinase/integrase [Vibrio rotiferianus]|uniref:tyrosine-type recombinase/integrase n=1 Tax=Vibrio rotiferianus TaxID=190895 RepID=UPI002893DCCC|nr:Site-specific recombinase XerD-like protein [Vibrio rotiferianus]CAH1559569.1 Site-specific recombinase XerD-like protein [Vibrio rotiferianus]
MEKRFKFTTAKITSLPPNNPDSRSTEAEYSCSDLSGFKLLVGKNGRKKWLVRYTLNGKKGSTSLGTFPEVPLTTARKQAQRIKMMVAEGIDPKESANKQEIPTVSEYFHNHYIKLAKTRKKTWRHDVARFKHCSDDIGDISYDQLKVSHIQSMIAKLMDKVHWRGTKFSKSSLNRILCVLKAMGRMVELEYGIPSVAHRVKLFPETGERQRWLSPSEIKRVFAELRKEEYCPIRSRFIILLFMLGCRERSIRAAKWSSICLESGVMRIPRDLSKSGYEHQIYLTPEAIAEFEALKKLRKPNNPYVFPGNKPNTYISQPRWMFNKMKQRLKLKDSDQIVFHTARHSYAACLISFGVDVGVLKQLMGHRSINSTMRYAKVSSTKQRQSAQLLTQMINEA